MKTICIFMTSLLGISTLPIGAADFILGEECILSSREQSNRQQRFVCQSEIYFNGTALKGHESKTVGALKIFPQRKQDSLQVLSSIDSIGLWRKEIETKISNNNLNTGVINSSIGVISGQVAGVNVGGSGTDRLAMLTSVRVRGNTSIMGGNNPLVIIDGISSDLVTLSTIYPSDIEKFEVLKNASETAQFGSRGAAGVIIVTTKKGRDGKFQISYDGNWGWESVYKNLEMLSA